MFDYVSRKDYEVERDLRIRAEAEASALREQVAFLKEQLRVQGQQYTDTLDRVLPKPERLPPFVGGNGHSLLSSDEIRRLPAVGKPGIRQRQRMLEEALKREEQEAEAEKRQGRRAELSPEEEAELDLVIGPQNGASG